MTSQGFRQSLGIAWQSDRKELREQALEFRRRLDDLESRVHELEERLPSE
jgi:hypothetical protein